MFSRKRDQTSGKKILFAEQELVEMGIVGFSETELKTLTRQAQQLLLKKLLSELLDVITDDQVKELQSADLGWVMVNTNVLDKTLDIEEIFALDMDINEADPIKYLLELEKFHAQIKWFEYSVPSFWSINEKVKAEIKADLKSLPK